MIVFLMTWNSYITIFFYCFKYLLCNEECLYHHRISSLIFFSEAHKLKPGTTVFLCGFVESARACDV